MSSREILDSRWLRPFGATLFFRASYLSYYTPRQCHGVYPALEGSSEPAAGGQFALATSNPLRAANAAQIHLRSCPLLGSFPNFPLILGISYLRLIVQYFNLGSSTRPRG